MANFKRVKIKETTRMRIEKMIGQKTAWSFGIGRKIGLSFESDILNGFMSEKYYIIFELKIKEQLAK